MLLALGKGIVVIFYITYAFAFGTLVLLVTEIGYPSFHLCKHRVAYCNLYRGLSVPLEKHGMEWWSQLSSKIKRSIGCNSFPSALCWVPLCHSVATYQGQTYPSEYHLDTTTSYRYWSLMLYWTLESFPRYCYCSAMPCTECFGDITIPKLIFSKKGENASLPFKVLVYQMAPEALHCPPVF